MAGRSARVASVIATLAAGCTVQPYAEPAAAPATPTYIEGASVASAPEPAEADVVDVPEPPVADIETYPSVEYGGVPVYYVGGQWYRRGPHGWAYYRQEPPELGRQRESHERDPRWVRAREAPRRTREQERGNEPVAPPARRDVVAPQPPERTAVPMHPQMQSPSPRGAAEPRPSERGAVPAPVVPAHVEETRAPSKPVETLAPPAPKPAPKGARPPAKHPPTQTTPEPGGKEPERR